MKPRQRNPTRTRQVQRALTLIELMVVVVVAAVLVALVAPSFRDLILNQRLKSIHAQVVTDLKFARAEAVARGVLVSVHFRPAGVGGTMSCYSIVTDAVRESAVPKRASNRCDCRQPAGSRCVAAKTLELRTVQVPVSQSVRFQMPVGQVDHFAFDPVTGGMLPGYTEAGLPFAGDIVVESLISNERRLRSIVGLAGRVMTCRPTGSVFGEVACGT